jgi:hypothetical protein
VSEVETRSGIGVFVGVTSIAFSTLCFLIIPVFTLAIGLAVLFGAMSGGLAWGLKARRTAIVAFTFALTPLCGFLLMEHVAERVGNGYVVFLPLGAAVVVAALAWGGHRRQRVGHVLR